MAGAYIERDISGYIRKLAGEFPVIQITGPRQSGKSTLAKKLFPEYRYVNLEEPDIRIAALDDPRGFLDKLGERVIIDEAQRAPDLFSYIQTRADEKNAPGAYILSGSQNFLTMKTISQSLAGRVGIVNLLPLSYDELRQAGLGGVSADEWVFRGGYPRLHAFGIEADDFFPGYLETYVERDIRLEMNVGDLNRFLKFIKICASRIGQLINLADIGAAISADARTIGGWLSALEASYIVFELKPYYNNFGKRISKKSKLYFYDTGLACSLLELKSASQIALHYLKGPLFENAVLAEYAKRSFNRGTRPSLYFWRESESREIDLIAEKADGLELTEIKSAATADRQYVKNILAFEKNNGAKIQGKRV
ncbi:MAG: ATP-binding protein, partial [Candidatus Accumulibacter sp.]|nr:ATP-binding protein [Accumulibacter sp.]